MNRGKPMLYVGLSILCCSLLVTEILFTRIFSVCLMYHYAFFVISVAMFGLGLGGICVQILHPQEKDNDERFTEKLFVLGLLLSVTGLLTPLLLFNVNMFGFFTLVSTAHIKMTLWLVLVFLLSSLPFFFGGMMTSLLFRHYSAHISKLYFMDLIGASAGCLLSIFLIELLGAPNAILLNALLASIGAFCFLFAISRKPPRRLMALFVFVFLSLTTVFILGLRYSSFDIKYAKGVDRHLIDRFSKWNSISRISVSKIINEKNVPKIGRDIWGVSSRFRDPYPSARMINIDGGAGTFLVHFNQDFKKVSFVQADPPSLVHRLKKAPKTLIIGAGGGKDVLSALSFGAAHVTAVELNPIIVHDVMLGEYLDFSGRLYMDQRVRAVAQEGRSFVASSREKFDIIQFAFVDTSAATSGGAFALAENNLYTVESFVQFLEHLEPDGIFSVCWVDMPYLKGATRLLSVMIAALEELGCENIGRNIAVVTNPSRADWIVRSILVKKDPFTPEEQKILTQAAEDLDFEMTYLPQEREPALSLNQIKTYSDFLKVLINNKEDRQLLYDSMTLDISPPTDDRPFFYYQYYPKDFLRALMFKQVPTLAEYPSGGSIVLIRILLIGTILVGFCYVVPFLLFGWIKTRGHSLFSVLMLLGYFSCLGFGFMLVEISMLQKLLLFLGGPLYSFSVTLFSLLLFAGLGSLWTQRFTVHAPSFYIRRAILGLLLLGILYLLCLPSLIDFFLGEPLPIKILISVFLLMPLSFLMGMPLPLAIKQMQDRARDLIPWMWGINGATSVLASIIAILWAMNFGYDLTLINGYLFYFLALLIVEFGFKKI
ncbi:MAG: hypothetical protein V1863_05485 [Candidatus Omnitrophota bacterium]